MTHTQAQSLLASQMECLIERGRAQGKRVTYLGIAQAIGESASNVRKLHLGMSANPSFKTLAAIARYFDVPVAYFACQTEVDCAAFLAAVDRATQEQAHQDKGQALASRFTALSPESLDIADRFVDHLLNLEGRPPRRLTAGRASAAERKRP